MRTSLFCCTFVFALPFWAYANPPLNNEPIPSEQAIISDVASSALYLSAVNWTLLGAPLQTVAASDGLTHVIYEMKLANDSSHEITVDRIEVLDAVTHAPTGHNQATTKLGEDITGQFWPFVRANPKMEAADFSQKLAPGQAGVVFFDLSYAANERIPSQLKHQVSISLKDKEGNPRTFTTEDDGVSLSRQPVLEIAAPLRGEGWLVGNGSGPILSPHRYTVILLNGTLRVPEHFALDLAKLGPDGKLFREGKLENQSFYGYNEEVLSVADGRVMEVLDGMGEQIPGQLIAPKTPAEYAGNHVIVALGKGYYALYAHFIPGSITVKEGDFVKTGQVLGRLGSSGNSDAPHLHFQIMNSPSVLNTNGLPFVFSKMQLQSRLQGPLDPSIDALMEGKPVGLDTSAVGKRNQKMPLSLDLLKF